jgi:hypothetical protein
MTSPFGWGDWTTTNPILGWSLLLDGEVFHLENVPFLWMSSMLVGGPVPGSPYVVRAGYALLTSTVAGLSGSIPSFLIVNLLGWALGVVVAYRFTRETTGSDFAAGYAALLACLACGYWFHVHDYSAHLAASSLYWAGIYLLYRSRVWEARQDLSTHLWIGCYLAAFALTYNTALSMLGVYAVFAIASRNRVLHVLGVSAGVVVFQRCWPSILDLTATLGGHVAESFPYYELEQRYMLKGLRIWSDKLGDPIGLVRLATRTVVGYLCSSDLPVVAAALPIALLRARRLRESPRRSLFFLLLFLAPTLTALPWGPSAIARGYVSNGGLLLVFALVGSFLAELQRSRAKRGLALLIAGALLALQAAWVASPLFGGVLPLMTYLFGPPFSLALLGEAFARLTPEVASLTGAEPTPIIAGGDAPLEMAGLAVTGFPELALPGIIGPTSLARALLLRGYLFLPLLGLLVLSRRRARSAGGSGNGRSWSSRRWLLVPGAATLLVWLLPALVNPVLLADEGFVVRTFRQVPLTRPAREIAVQVELGVDAVRQIEEAARRGDRVTLHHWAGLLWSRAVVDADVRVDGVRLPVPEWIPPAEMGPLQALSMRSTRPLVLDPQGLARVARPGSVLEIRLVSRVKGPIRSPIRSFCGWQRNPLPGRTLLLDGRVAGPEEAPILPMLELRFRSANGWVRALAF